MEVEEEEGRARYLSCVPCGLSRVRPPGARVSRRIWVNMPLRFNISSLSFSLSFLFLFSLKVYQGLINLSINQSIYLFLFQTTEIKLISTINPTKQVHAESDEFSSHLSFDTTL